MKVDSRALASACLRVSLGSWALSVLYPCAAYALDISSVKWGDKLAYFMEL